MKAKIKQILINLGLLLLLHVIIDQVYVYIYPAVSPLRALFIGATATAVLWLFRKKLKLVFWKGGLAIFSSAFIGALLVQAGILTSKSALSAVIHALILIITYLLCSYGRENNSN